MAIHGNKPRSHRHERRPAARRGRATDHGRPFGNVAKGYLWLSKVIILGAPARGAEAPDRSGKVRVRVEDGCRAPSASVSICHHCRGAPSRGRPSFARRAGLREGECPAGRGRVPAAPAAGLRRDRPVDYYEIIPSNSGTRFQGRARAEPTIDAFGAEVRTAPAIRRPLPHRTGQLHPTMVDQRHRRVWRQRTPTLTRHPKGAGIGARRRDAIALPVEGVPIPGAAARIRRTRHRPPGPTACVAIG
jgi:hypothetical protein